MRFAAFALAAAVAACNPSAPSGEADGGGGGLFPDLSNSAYRAEATISNEDGSTIPVVMIRDGRNMRMEINAAEGLSTLIANAETGESYIISSAGGRQVAIRASGLGDQFTNPAEEWQGELSREATQTGSCSVAGQTGAEWTKTTDADGTDTVCVTNDGIILRATDDGRVVWETTRVQRGAQNAALFTVPEGVEVMDLGNMGAMMNEAMERAKNANR
jgi:hypothetical protein